MKTLKNYGWNDIRATDWTARKHIGLIPARVVVDHGQHYKVVTPDEVSAQLSGALMHKMKTVDMPKIGDWVAIEQTGDRPAIIQEVLPRTTEIVRGQAGRLLNKQVIAANIDVAFIMQPLDHDFSVQRLERYIFQLANQNITSVILLNKSDQSDDAADKQAQLANLDAKSIIMSATEDETVSTIETEIASGKTAVIMGSSGAGKSTLTNRLLREERQTTAAIRERDSKGRHTTVHRELFLLPGGGMIIDTPGIRELQLWGNVSDLEASFPEIAEAIKHCRFKNCSHTNEDGCAVKQGIEDGTIEAKRFNIYLNFKHELETLETRRDFIEERRSQQTKESAKRRHRRAIRNSEDEKFDFE
ncbi:MAG: ribosome small subunit-dependent GTPase A [Candidatus Saccharibacteria bacterium]